MSRTAYFVGIKGVGMTSLAVYLMQQGYDVTGSDVEDVFQTDEVLQKQGISVQRGFSAENIHPVYDLVIVTGAHGGMTNPEAQEALRYNIPTFMHGKFLGECMNQKRGISVAGCHGKTTTSSMIATLLSLGGHDSSYAIGAAGILPLGAGGHWGRGDYFVAEADEYVTCPFTDPTPRFLWQHPHIAVITNIEYDHPDVYPSLAAVKKAYMRFAAGMSRDSIIIACADDPVVVSCLEAFRKNHQVYTYGITKAADYQVKTVKTSEGNTTIRMYHKKRPVAECILHVPGEHNTRNALAASVVANLAGMEWKKIEVILPKFQGAKRRFERIGLRHDVILYDDYAHHPSEIAATIQAARQWYPQRRLIVLFQPHTYSRTKKLLPEFAACFRGADLAILTDIYPSARELPDSSISSEQIVRQAQQYGKLVRYLPTKDKTLEFLSGYVRPNDIIITMGAGTIYTWGPDILSEIP